MENNDVNIFVCYHKNSFIINNQILKPIHVGKELSSVNLDMIGDNTGDNISYKNKHFCELTATYWIWKNIKSDIVGLFHYRRFFNLLNDIDDFHYIDDDFSYKFGLTKDNIQKILSQYDIILPRRVCTKPKSVYDMYKKEHVGSDFDVVLDVIKEKYPHSYKTVLETAHSNYRYDANMIICKKNIFDEYAGWLFDILFEVEKRIQDDVLKRDQYQQRVYGFLSERMMGLFVATHTNWKIKEVPILFYEENEEKYKKSRFKKFRRRIKRKIADLFRK